MSYRPQYAYPIAPRGSRYEQFHYSFDSTNTDAFQTALAAGAQTDAINLQTEQDALFKCRAVRFTLSTSASLLYCELRTPHGDYLQRPFAPLALWAGPTGIVGAGSLLVPLEPEIEAPLGGAWTVYFYNPTSGPIAFPAITLDGLKLRCVGRAA
jgi:hypothetical protein